MRTSNVLSSRHAAAQSARCHPVKRGLRETDHLRVLIANERKDRLALVAPIVVALGHEVIAREIEVADVGLRPRASDPTSPS